ncbi:MAG TPA: hypothetical protein VJ979_08355 [Actinomycetota bacterium]|nr:hypothetical protein [Actinomycetota bacterium]
MAAQEGGAATGASTRPDPLPIGRLQRQRALRRVGLAALGLLVIAGLLNLFGVWVRVAAASRDGVTLEVSYAAVTRSGLETPWTVVVRSSDGFDGPITIATSAEYFERFDFNQWYPEPSSSAIRDDVLLLSFEAPPAGSRDLTVRFDGRASPSFGLGSHARTELETDGLPSLAVDYRTVVMP